MNKFSTFIKILSALAAVVGAVYIIATYGDKIVAWAKQLMGCNAKPIASFHYTAAEDCTEEKAEPTEEAAEATAAAAEEAPEAPAAESAPEAPAADEATPIANEEDFEG